MAGRSDEVTRSGSIRTCYAGVGSCRLPLAPVPCQTVHSAGTQGAKGIISDHAGAHTVQTGEGRTVALGVIRMRVLAAGEPTAQAFTLVAFEGGEGPWTVPHLHREMEESFYILDEIFTFTIGEQTIDAGPGAYVLVQRGTPHVMAGGPGGGRFLTLLVTGGLEEMFFELGTLPPDALRNREIRAAISERYDSFPVT